MIRVLHLIATLEVGGVERQLVERLSREEPAFEDRVLCLTRGGPLRAELEGHGIPVEVLGKAGAYDARILGRLVTRIAAHRPDVVHTYMFTANFWGRLAACLLGGPPVVTSVRCLDPAEMRGLHLWADRLLARRSARVVAVSGAIARYLAERVGTPPERIRIVRNAQDPARFPPDRGGESLRRELDLPPEARLVSLVGRLHPQKGHELLLAALPDLLTRVPETHLLLVGEGPSRAELEALAAESRHGGRVRFLGRREDVGGVYAASDVVVLPSRFEGLPNVLVEAMAAARPVVATRIPGNDEVVVEGRTGLLVPPEDPLALADALARLLEDPTRAAEMGRRGRQRFLEAFTLDEAAAALRAVEREAARAA